MNDFYLCIYKHRSFESLFLDFHKIFSQTSFGTQPQCLHLDAVTEFL